MIENIPSFSPDVEEDLASTTLSVDVAFSPLAYSLDGRANKGNHLVVIDPSVGDIDQLMAGIESARVVVLDGEQNAIAQITQILSEYTGQAALGAASENQLDSFHIISHADRGLLYIGDNAFDADSLLDYSDELIQWGKAISSEGDILLYGCSLAAGAEGLQFIEQLSHLTGADVAASNDLTGRGGNWDLEVTTGSVEAQVSLSAIAQTTYQGTLATYNGKEYILTNGFKTWEAAQAEAKQRGGNLVTINSAAEEAWLKQTFGQNDLWIGINDKDQEGQFKWVSGEAVTYTNWAAGEPNDWAGNQDYGRMNFSSKKEWDDMDGSALFQGIIEINAAPPPELPTYGGSQYALTRKATWEAAQAEAKQRGGNLVTINSAAEEAWLKQTFGQNDLWIGINDKDQEGQFKWVSGEAVTYTNWAAGEPNDWAGNQDYGRMNFSSKKEWDDMDGSALFQGIIEIKQTPPAGNAGIIGLKTGAISVNENAGYVDVSVLRQQGSDGIVTVDYRTVPGTATAEDYQQRSGTLTFGPGETQKSARIPILQDDQVEGEERFGFAIDNVTGGATLLTPRTAQITIVDDDAPAPKIYRDNKYVLTGKTTWEAAQAEAQKLNGNLVTINSAAEETWLKQTFGQEDFWIGINDKDQEGRFKWASGEAVTYTNWAAGEPNNWAGNQDYGRMNFSSKKEWDDIDGNALFRGIIEIGGNNSPPVSSTNPIAQSIIGGLNQPTAIEWTPDSSKLFVAEKGGVVKIYENGKLLAQPFIDISSQVNASTDRGLLDIAIHPNFSQTPYVYLLYTYDPPQVNNHTGLAGPDGDGNRAGRLIRVTADRSNNYRTAVAGSEVVLLGKNSTWNNFNAFVDSTIDFDEPPAGILPGGGNLQDFLAADSLSHSVGSVEFGKDGTLYVSNGDGTSFNRADRRASRVQDINNFSGKLLRIDPITGQGLSDNPFYNGDRNANQSKVYQLGLRNPFRFAIDPKTGRPIIGDVGWAQWEEINSAGPGANFGWPYYEGGNRTSAKTSIYKDFPEAQQFYNSNPTVTPSLLAISHDARNPRIHAIVMGDIYDGNVYDEKYRGDIFYNHLDQGIVRHASVDSAGRIIDVGTFTTGSEYVVQMKVGPDGLLYYVDLDDGVVGRWTFA